LTDVFTRRSAVAALGGVASSLAMPAIAKAPALPANRGKVRIRHLAYSDLGGRPDSVQVMVSRKHLYVGHMFADGFTVMDVANPTKPRPVKFVAAAPNTRTHHLQAHDKLLLVIQGPDIPTLAKFDAAVTYYERSTASEVSGKANFFAGMKIYDTTDPADPKLIGALGIPGVGVNRIWWDGGRYAYLAAHMNGFTDHMVVIADISDPTRPTIAGRWWLPGMWAAGGETLALKGRVALHHMIVADGIGYAAWRDGGFTILDVADPAHIKMLNHTITSPPQPGGTHTPLPLPGRKMAVMLDESNGFACAKGISYTWLYDVKDKMKPLAMSSLPTPDERDWCLPGQNFGPHNLHENRSDAFRSEEILFSTYHNAGLRIFDIRDAHQPREIGRYVPPSPTKILDPRPGYLPAPLSCDINVQPDGVMYLSDWNAGLHVLQYEG
jgi:hypothetical protein